MSDIKFWYNKSVLFITPGLESTRFDFEVEDQMLKDHIQPAAEVETSFHLFLDKHSPSLNGKDDAELACCPRWTKHNWQNSRTGENLTSAQRASRSIPRVHPPMRQAYISPEWAPIHSEETPSLKSSSLLKVSFDYTEGLGSHTSLSAKVPALLFFSFTHPLLSLEEKATAVATDRGRLAAAKWRCRISVHNFLSTVSLPNFPL